MNCVASTAIGNQENSLLPDTKTYESTTVIVLKMAKCLFFYCGIFILCYKLHSIIKSPLKYFTFYRNNE